MVMFHAIIFVDIEVKTINLLEQCLDYIGVEQICSLAVSGVSTILQSETNELRTSLLNLENSLIDAVSADLTSAMCYIATFLVEDKYVFLLFIMCLPI